jgi:hypothetical protein
MTRWTALTAAAMTATALWWTPAAAQTPPKCDPARAPQQVSGQVVKLDIQKERVTIRGTDGVTHEFAASKETLADMKVGDQISAKLRSC